MTEDKTMLIRTYKLEDVRKLCDKLGYKLIVETRGLPLIFTYPWIIIDQDNRKIHLRYPERESYTMLTEAVSKLLSDLQKIGEIEVINAEPDPDANPYEISGAEIVLIRIRDEKEKRTTTNTNTANTNKYRDIQMEFVEYYKYCFTYHSKDGRIVVTVGGDPDDIYRLQLKRTMTIEELLQYEVIEFREKKVEE